MLGGGSDVGVGEEGKYVEDLLFSTKESFVEVILASMVDVDPTVSTFVRVELCLLREIRKSDEQWCEDPHVSRSQTESRWSRIRIDVNANRGLDNICPRQVNLSEDAVSS